MNYITANILLKVNGSSINVGSILDDGSYVTNTEYRNGIKEFLYSCDCSRIEENRFVGEFIDFKATKHVDEKWIDELKRQGYNTDKLINVES